MSGRFLNSRGAGRGRLEVNADPNVIPFIDVMLVLVIIFMVAAPIATVDVKIDLPATTDIAASERPPTPTWVSLKEDQRGLRVYVMNQEVQFGEVGAKVRAAVIANDPKHAAGDQDVLGARIYLRADAKTKYRNVLRVMDEVSREGFVRVAFVTEDRR